MSNDEAGKTVNRMTDSTKQAQNTAEAATSSEPGRIISLTPPPGLPEEALAPKAEPVAMPRRARRLSIPRFDIEGDTPSQMPEILSDKKPESSPSGMPTSAPLSAEYVRIPIAGRLPVRVKDSDWPIRYQCIVPFRQRGSSNQKDREISFFESMHSHISGSVNISILKARGADDIIASEIDDDYDYDYLFHFKSTPPSRPILRPVEVDTQKTESGFWYKDVFVFLRCHQDGRAILYATYKQSGVEFPLEGVILSPESGCDAIFDYFQVLFSEQCLWAWGMSEYDWIATLVNASRKPVEQLSPDVNRKDCVEFINEDGRMVSFSTTEWPIVASSSLGKGEVSSSLENPGVFYYEHLDVHKHSDGRVIIHAYQEYNSSTRAILQDDNHVFDVFLMSKGMVVPEQVDLYSTIQELVRRMGFAPEIVSLCVNSLPGEDLV